MFNGVSTINNELYHDDVYTDASKKGFGAQLGRDWLAGTWHNPLPLELEHDHISKPSTIDIYSVDNINELELWAVLAAIMKWCHLFRNKSVNIYTDNLRVYHNILGGRSANMTNMSWIRELFWLCVIHNVNMIPNYVNTKENVVADTLSRLPYESTRRDAEELLKGYNLCCSQSLFDFCRHNTGGTHQQERNSKTGIST